MILPKVWSEGFNGHEGEKLELMAAEYSRLHELPLELAEWDPAALREKIWNSLGVSIDHELDLDIRTTGIVQQDGYTIRKIAYQSRKDFYVTANLYVPDGEGPFPGVINMHGHHQDGHLAGRVQERGHALAKMGYVCLTPDAFGAGERSIEHGTWDYHGFSLGLSLLNIGETLMGIQVVDNMRGVDLLCSLPFVDPERIGATGASGGGNQTMWLTALDERIKASVPVVSVGSFESYIMTSNCVCELLPGGLTYTEEAGVIALIAPRAVKICNALHDICRAFAPSEMLRTFARAEKIYSLMGAHDNCTYQIFNTEHGYWQEIQETMLGWFELHLKGIGHGLPVKRPDFHLMTEEEALVFPLGQRPEYIINIEEYCRKKAAELAATRSRSKEDLRRKLGLKTVTFSEHSTHTTVDGWERYTLRGSDGRLVPLLLKRGKAGEAVTVFAGPDGKDALTGTDLFREISNANGSIALFDPYACGENSTENAYASNFAEYSRSLLWLGMSLQGKWVEDYTIVCDFLKAVLPTPEITVAGHKDLALAALLYSVLQELPVKTVMEQGPVSLVYQRQRKDFFTMALYVQDILKIADIPDLCDMAGGMVRQIQPV